MKTILLIALGLTPVAALGGDPPRRESKEACEKLYKEVDGRIKKANHCKTDADCATMELGGAYIEFGCWHYVHKSELQPLYDAVKDYHGKCSQIINDCARSPKPKCVAEKCVAKDKK